MGLKFNIFKKYKSYKNKLSIENKCCAGMTEIAVNMLKYDNLKNLQKRNMNSQEINITNTDTHPHNCLGLSCISCFLDNHFIFWPWQNPRAASSHDRKRTVSQVPFPQATMFIPASYGRSAAHTDQHLGPRLGRDPRRRQKPSQP